ncbi:hypothetical protein E2K80_09085 [Rhodophyticola sp. CCM32]|uniref:hypothetical protein n=1 Tax=Rhodophyticola sp. CCM32 TaxID=2916397 RepID=UPI00107F955B|nr:hypothetical protein [Rhodophyticola sp. CCM32]QBY00860.1 hypothetical protein E2K80_09085 [Rhodophyticola sp. CCM32]
MYPRAARIFRHLFPFLTLMAVIWEAVVLLVGQDSSGANLVVYWLLALIFHRSVLLGEDVNLWGVKKNNAPDIGKWPFGQFAWRSVILIAPSVMIFILVVFVVFRAVDDGRSETAILMALLTTGLFFQFWAAGFGTMLPAAAVHGDASFSAAARRGKRTYWATFGRLMAGGFLTTILLFVAMIGLATMWPALLDTEIQPIWLIFLIDVILRLVGFIPTLLTAVALSMAYERFEGAITD